jgi:hypothetical protein
MNLKFIMYNIYKASKMKKITVRNETEENIDRKFMCASVSSSFV